MERRTVITASNKMAITMNKATVYIISPSFRRPFGHEQTICPTVINVVDVTKIHIRTGERVVL